MRVNKSIEDGSFFDNAVLARGVRARAARAPARARLARRRPLAPRPPAGAAPLRAGEDVDPCVHRRARRLADLGRARPPGAPRRSHRLRHRAGTGRWTATSVGADAARLRRDRRSTAAPRSTTSPPRSVRATRRASPTSSSSRSSSPVRRRSSRATAAIFFNFRPDRGRQLTRLLLDAGRDVTTMTRYASDLDTPVAFDEREVDETIAQVLSAHGLRQLHVAETEKYAHVTYFFNGGREREWPGETRVLVPSPRDVPSYDHKPEMSADEVATRVVDEVGDGYAYCVVNFANPDMVGHTGSIPAVIQRGRDGRRMPRPRGRAGHRARRRVPHHGRPRERRADARARRRRARTRRTRRTPCR